ncbi:hypothetical protein [Frateuria soli]|uniref:hypothetical protein n=1 Tax=Frateuria soli TaxID=1542730 RepID=UPI001E314795|nr:hypothetical protein [Frateuria soli]UGB39533.1 hypothetical protein LQ771_06815 [Frateuria soli]
MTASLRPFARSRALRALGLMGWLMLVISSLAAAPAGMGQIHEPPMQAATAMADGSSQGLAHDDHAHASSHDCCDQHGDDPGSVSGQACGCVGMCASAVPPMAPGVLMASWVSGGYAQPLRLRAPSAPVSPPLRPPSV